MSSLDRPVPDADLPQVSSASDAEASDVSVEMDAETFERLVVDELDRLLGRTPTLAARGKFANGALELADLQLKGAALSARSAGRIGPRGLLDLTLDWSATGPFRAGPIEISGRGSGKGTVTGDLGAPRASLVSRLESVALPDLVLRDVIAGEDRQHAGHGSGLFRVDLPDIRMGMRRPQEIGMGLPRTVDIVRVVALAGDEAEIFLARNACANSSGRHDAPPELAAFGRAWPGFAA